jgi:hypothetical protein
MATSAFQAASNLVGDALKYEGGQNFVEANRCYVDALVNFDEYLRHETNPVKRAQVSKKVGQYRERSNFVQSLLRKSNAAPSHAPSLPSAGVVTETKVIFDGLPAHLQKPSQLAGNEIAANAFQAAATVVQDAIKYDCGQNFSEAHRCYVAALVKFDQYLLHETNLEKRHDVSQKVTTYRERANFVQSLLGEKDALAPTEEQQKIRNLGTSLRELTKQKSHEKTAKGKLVAEKEAADGIAPSLEQPLPQQPAASSSESLAEPTTSTSFAIRTKSTSAEPTTFAPPDMTDAEVTEAINVLKEILQTEKIYVQKLEILAKHWCVPSFPASLQPSLLCFFFLHFPSFLSPFP